VAEENPLRSATSRMVMALGGWRLRSDSGSRLDFAFEGVGLVDFESGGAIESLKFSLLLADTTVR
jgi:hypothetical protein